MKLDPLLDQGLPRLVLRMCFAGDDELHRTLRDSSTDEAAAVGRATAGLVSYRSRSVAQSRVSMRWDRRDVSPSPPPRSTRPRQPVAWTTVRECTPQETCWRAIRNCQSLASETRRMSCSRVSVVPSQRCFPQLSVQRSSAGAESQVGMWTPLVTCPTGTSSSGHRGNRGRKRLRLTLPCKPAHSINCAAAANCQVCHVEALRRVARVLAAESQQIVKFNVRAFAWHSARGTVQSVREQSGQNPRPQPYGW